MTKNNYAYLHQQVAALIEKFGSLEKAIEFLDNILLSGMPDEEKVSFFINSSVANYFNITVDELIKEQGHARYRTVCYKLHKEFLKLSIRKTMVKYNKKENAVMLGIRSIENTIDNPAIDMEIYECYLKMKKNTNLFIKHITGEKEQ